MIKIRINNLLQKKQEYGDAVIDVISIRIAILQKSLRHLNGAVVDFTAPDLSRFRPITRDIVNTVGDLITIPNGRHAYTNAVNNYRANPNNLGNINIVGLIQLCDDLLANNEQQLRDLLVADAHDLLRRNSALLNNYGVNNPQAIAVIRLAFDYQKYNDIAEVIRSYFRANAFSKFCSYCNAEPVSHRTNNAGRVVASYELDHFYDKARYPLLGYSLLNLVPSDHTCNVTNKGVINFNDQFHLNPHFMGYDDKIVFIPVGITTSFEVKTIEVKILEPQGTVLYRQINGNNQPKDEIGDEGNLNVFKIRSKYSDKLHRAYIILKGLHNENTYLKHIGKYLKSLRGLDRIEHYKKWYEKEFDVRFDSLEYNDKAFSKFSRDIHDHYYDTYKTRLNSYIRDIINA